MRHALLILAVISLMLGGCKFIDRTFNKKKRQKELLEQMRIDSIAKVRADSIELVERYQRELEQIRLDSIQAAEELAMKIKKFHVIAGSFKIAQNAESFSKRMSCEGYTTEILEGKNGFSFVSIGSFDTFKAAEDLVKKVRDEGEYIVWIHIPKR